MRLFAKKYTIYCNEDRFSLCQFYRFKICPCLPALACLQKQTHAILHCPGIFVWNRLYKIKGKQRVLFIIPE